MATHLSHMLGSEHDLEPLGISRRVDLDVSLMMLGVLLELGTEIRHLVTFSVYKDLEHTAEEEEEEGSASRHTLEMKPNERGEGTHDMSSSDLLNEFGVLRSVDVLGEGDGLDRHPKRDLLAVHALDVVQASLVRDVLSKGATGR
jgi:hypothetical protein